VNADGAADFTWVNANSWDLHRQCHACRVARRELKVNAITQVIVSIRLVIARWACKRVGMRVRTYRLVVKGEVSHHVWGQLEGMSLRYAGGNTVLLGLVRDKAELQGLLGRVSNLGMTLISVEAIDGAAGHDLESERQR
jgi:hypothetical protein